ncbi:unnamed protein product [Rotaria socialis]|uniref:Uncharacterized protein n=1 Tax=Rotaria socialis TaxID=392032 RepID=A0A820SUD0_9BILA|nr:unnamed protein product [Rotaria socialis]CAF4437933.1 unnamed protein product [Rotaria socialis]CAF4459766.1 unnamed protein product [Rotaria socialis]
MSSTLRRIKSWLRNRLRGNIGEILLKLSNLDIQLTSGVINFIARDFIKDSGRAKPIPNPKSLSKTTSLFMAENSVYDDDSEIDSLNADSTTMDIYDDVTVSTDSSTLIFNLCNNMAKRIKDQAVNTIEHTIVDTSSKT